MADAVSPDRSALVDEECGGDPPCWEGLIDDQRDQESLRDLDSPTQIHDLVTAFYREVVFDELLEPMFDVAEVDWAEHIPKLIDYWCWTILGINGYPGAVTRTHRRLHRLRAVEAEHCDRWYELWVASVDRGWTGPHAEHAKDHAARLMAGMAKHVFGYAWSPSEPA